MQYYFTDKNIEHLYELYQTEWDFEEKSLFSSAIDRVQQDMNCSRNTARRLVDELVRQYNLPEPCKVRTGWMYAAEAVTGTTHTEEHRKKISEANKGRVLSEEWRKNISEGMKGKKRGPYKKHAKSKD